MTSNAKEDLKRHLRVQLRKKDFVEDAYGNFILEATNHPIKFRVKMKQHVLRIEQKRTAKGADWRKIRSVFYCNFGLDKFWNMISILRAY